MPSGRPALVVLVNSSAVCAVLFGRFDMVLQVID